MEAGNIDRGRIAINQPQTGRNTAGGKLLRFFIIEPGPRQRRVRKNL
jgi:hypothetical protein